MIIRLKHIRRSLAVLREAGASDITVTGGRHFHIVFMINGRHESMTMSSSPRQPEMIPRFVLAAIRRMA